MDKTKAPAWAEVNLDNLKHNYRAIRSIVDEKAKVCCVVKANACGSGSIMVAKTLEKENADYFAVARFEEGLELRQNGITTPILVLSHTREENLEDAVKNDISLTVYTLDRAQKISESSKKIGKKGKIHIKVDSGMNRIGFKPVQKSVEDIVEISKLDNIYLEGIFTHFACADEIDKIHVEEQMTAYNYMLSELEKKGVTFDLKHVSNSAAIIDSPELNFNMVRAGIILSGHYPSNEVKKERIELRPVMKLKSIITNVKQIKKGDGISYGLTYKAQKDEIIATVAIGYADGYTRMQKNPKVLIKGKMYDVVGRICMDQMMVRLGENDSNIKIGDEVVLFGEGEATVERIAKDLGTINYEVLCMVNRRVDRVYFENNEVVGITSNLLK